MTLHFVKYVRDIEDSLQQYSNEGYELYSIEKVSRMEIRFFLRQAGNSTHLCLARVFLSAFYPNEFDDRDIELPESYCEIRTDCIDEYKQMYLQHIADGLIEAVPNDDLNEVDAIKLKDSKTLLVHPDGHTWE